MPAPCQPDRSRQNAATRPLVVVVLALALLGGCVLQHPVDPATPAAMAWYQTHKKLIDLEMDDIGNINSPPSLATPDDLAGYCDSLAKHAKEARKVPPIPSKVLQVQWWGAQTDFIKGADLCTRSLDTAAEVNDSARLSDALTNIKYRNQAYMYVGFGRVRLSAVLSAMGASLDRPPPAIAITTTSSAVSTTSN